MADPTRSRRWVLHLDMDAFFASAEQLTRPTLRGRPVMVGGLGGRGVVAGCSYEARAFGARSAMPMHQARRLVGGGAIVLPPRMALYSALSKGAFDALRLRMPVLEQLSVDEAFGEPAELAGAGEDEVRAFCEDLRALVLVETGMVASIGAGAGKHVAKIASGLAKPNGVAVVPPARQHELLDSLPVRKLWGIGPVAEEKLKRLGIVTIGGFARTPAAEVASILGNTVGPSLHRLAQGVDDRPVAERADAKQISAESTFASDIVTLGQLRAAVENSGGAAFSRLEKDGRAARTVVLKLKKSDMSVLTRSVTLPYATLDRAVLIASAQKQVIDPVELGPIRLVGVGFAGLSTVRQGSLFPELDQDVPGYAIAPPSGEAEDPPVPARVPQRYWHPGLDVSHPQYGHGWVQGAGHGVVTVRFETRSTGTGIAKTFPEDNPFLEVADALASLL